MPRGLTVNVGFSPTDLLNNLWNGTSHYWLYPLATLTSKYWFYDHRLFSRSVGIKPVVTGYPRGTPDFFLTVYSALTFSEVDLPICMRLAACGDNLLGKTDLPVG